MSVPQGIFKAYGHRPKKQAVRRARDFYRTPEPVTEAFLKAEQPYLTDSGAIHDPGCGDGDGDGAILNVFRTAGFVTGGTDIKPLCHSAKNRSINRVDLIKLDTLPTGAGPVICNPPYGLISPRGGE